MPKRNARKPGKPAQPPEDKDPDRDDAAGTDDDIAADLSPEAEPENAGKAAGAAGEADAALALLDPEAAEAEREAERLLAEYSAALGPRRLAKVRDSVSRFLAEARRYKRLSETEERALGVAARERGDLNAARTLVVHNLRLVISIAYQYRRAWTNILDLFQEGSVGLMEAVKRWEPKLGQRFGTYAAYWIRAFVLRFLMTNSRLIHVGNTRAGRKLFFRLEKERQKLLAAGIEITPKLLAAKLDVDEEALAEVSRHLDSREVPFDPRPGDAAGDVDGGYALSE